MGKGGTRNYVSVVAHSSGTFATDLTAGKWLLIFDSNAQTASQVTFTPAGTIAASNVQAAIEEAASDAVQKASNLSDVTAATARTNLSVPSKAEIQNQTFVYWPDTGTAEALVITPSPSLAAYATGQRVSVKKTANANATTTPTLNANSLGAKVIFKNGGLALQANDMLANGHYEFEYDAAYNAAAGGWELLNPRASVSISFTLGTEQATTSGTSIDFTGIPAGAKRITIMFKGVSTSGFDDLLIQLGDSGGVENAGYSAVSFQGVAVSFTTGFGLQVGAAGNVHNGAITLTLENAAAFSWCASGVVAYDVSTTGVITMGGSKSLSAELDRIRITTVGGTETFDAGAINISYE